MEYVIGGLVLLLILRVVLRRRDGTPSVEVLAAIERAVRELQRRALENVFPDHEDEIRNFDEERMLEQSMRVEETIRLVYTAELEEGGVRHIISSQLLQKKGRKYQLQCMLLVMLALNRQLAEAGIGQDSVKFEVHESELGTHYVSMLLTAEQNDRLAKTTSAPS